MSSSNNKGELCRIMLKWREDYYVGEGIKDAAKARKRIDAGRMAFGGLSGHIV